ncbi:MAG: hypothetical protein CL675_04905 [Bdellovibrionaceae bacterium]|mgnify:CR=1 FL=1|nr:hypothetical protein [Pseudobdellovibrionaceae bacterium]|tara:strand:+ start:677 stop:1270 length:594 start_codon:yes stop_codon:yes gene_type:complete
MLKVEQARSGDPILKWNNRLLSSRIDPRKEAVSFVNGLDVHPSTDVLLFIGLASGYQLVEAVKRFPDLHIIAIDGHGPICEWIKKTHGMELRHAELKVLSQEDKGALQHLQARLLGVNYQLVQIPSVRHIFPKWAYDLQDHLNFRSQQAFRFLVEKRSWSHATVETCQLASIKELSEAVPKGSGLRPFVKILRELVK